LEGRKIFWRTISYLIILVFAIIALFPFYWMIRTALTSAKDSFSLRPQILPSSITLENLEQVITSPNVPFLKYFQNSVVVSILTTLLVIIVGSWGAYAQAALAAGSPPEVGQQGPDVALGFAAAKNLIPLDDVLDSISKDKFVELQKEAYVVYEGVTYAIAWWSETRVLFYHKDLLEKAGVKPPTTWDELSAAAKTLTKGDQYGFIFGTEGAAAGQFWIPLGMSAGGVVLDKDGKVTINSQPFKDALNFSASFIKDKSMPEAAVTYKSAETTKLFQLKQVAMSVGNGDNLESLRGIDPNLAANIGVVQMPVKKAGDISRSFLGGFLLFAFKGAKNPEGAKALIKFMYGDPWYSEYMQKTNGAALPVLKATINTDFYQKDPNKKVLLDQLKTAVRYAGPVFGNTPYMGQAEGSLVFSNALISVMTGKTSTDDALATVEKELKKLAGQ